MSDLSQQAIVTDTHETSTHPPLSSVITEVEGPGSSLTTSASTGRAQRACSICSRAKIRCNGQMPCGKCIALGQPGGCVYLPSMRGKTRKRKADREREPSSIQSKTQESPDTLPDDAVSRSNPDREADFALWKWNAGISAPSTSALWPSNPNIEPSEANTKTVLNGVDAVTTFPLPGDAPNPLATLAEACATTTSKTKRLRPDDDDRFYAPVAKVLKTDAPHIMTIISVQE